MTARLLTNIGRLWTGSEFLSNAAILISDDRIAWVGPSAELPRSVPGVVDDIVDVDLVENLGGGLVTPGLIDAHTHPVYAGNRYAELAMRSSGLSDTEITAAGGGISSTITVTRGTDPWTLCNNVRERLAAWLQSGTTTIEAKTGYHLTRDGELADVRMLRSLENEPGMPRVHVTFFAAHSVPPEFFGRRSDYIDAVCAWCADAAAVGADSVDVNCEEGRFTEDEARWILNAGRRSGLLPRLHACGNTQNGAARVAAEIGCASADLLHAATDDDVAALGRGGVAAVICPARPSAGRQAAGAVAARQGRGGRARLRSHARRRRHHLDAAGDRAGRVLPGDVGHRGAAGGHPRRRARAARARPGRDGPRQAGRHRALGRRPRGRLRLELRPAAPPRLARRRARHPLTGGSKTRSKSAHIERTTAPPAGLG